MWVTEPRFNARALRPTPRARCTEDDPGHPVILKTLSV
jgi:hypothetical protein